MARIEDGIYSYLAGLSGVSSLVSTRIFPVKAPQNAGFPCIVFQKVSGFRESDHSGDAGLTRPRFQFACYGKTYLSAKNVAQQVVKAFSGYSGAMGSTSACDSMVEDEVDGLDPDTKLYRVIVDVVIWHNETIA